MKRVILLLVVLLLVVSATAQNLPEGDARNNEFRRHFVSIVGANPDVKDFMKMPEGAVYRLPDGKTDRLPSGKFGIWGNEFRKTYGVPYEQFARTGSIRPIPEGVTAPAVKAALVATTPTKAKEKFYALSPWEGAIILLVLIGIGLLVTISRRAEMRRLEEEAAHDAEVAAARAEAEAAAAELLRREEEEREWQLSLNPVTSGYPYVRGGIAPHETERLQNFFVSQATSHYAERTGQEVARILVSQVGPIERGLIHGQGEVGYLGQKPKPRRISEPGIRAYRARFRFPDGTEEELVCLAGCMNPTRGFGGDVYRGFTFVPDEAIVAPPVPPTETVPIPEDATVTVIDEPEVVGGPETPEIVPSSDGVIRLEVKPPTPGKPLTLVSMSGVHPGSASVELKGNTISFKFLPATVPADDDRGDLVRINPEARHLAG